MTAVVLFGFVLSSCKDCPKPREEDKKNHDIPFKSSLDSGIWRRERAHQQLLKVKTVQIILQEAKKALDVLQEMLEAQEAQERRKREQAEEREERRREQQRSPEMLQVQEWWERERSRQERSREWREREQERLRGEVREPMEKLWGKQHQLCQVLLEIRQSPNPSRHLAFESSETNKAVGAIIGVCRLQEERRYFLGVSVSQLHTVVAMPMPSAMDVWKVLYKVQRALLEVQEVLEKLEDEERLIRDERAEKQ
ncbi:hypothetical protein AGMMS49531_04680 [Endomicrobiia bacterium]|nr:hypothetical protein AGMMS49531_04680 [Endomicrobiia bacterium]